MRMAKTIMIVLTAAALLCSCSNEADDKTGSGKVDTVTREIGQEAASMIKTPIDKAQAAADLEGQRVREMDEQNSR